MKICLLLFLLVLIPIVATTTAYGTHQAFETQCNISIDAKLIPITHQGESRNNPGGTVYPGDGFHYLFKFKGSDTCGGFGPEKIRSEGAYNILSHDISHDISVL